MNKIHLDFETRSTQDIKKVGSWAYAMHPSTEITCLSWAANNGKPVIWKKADIYRGLKFHAKPGWRLTAHSAHFEYAVYNYILHKELGWAPLWDPGSWDCTLARAAMCNLPLSLDNCGRALGLEIKKDLEGKAAMLKLCKPIDYDPLTNAPVYNESPTLYAQMESYCASDVLVEMGIDSRLPELNPHERAIFELDLIMNHRGVMVDVPLAKKAAALASVLTEDLNAQLKRLTNGAVEKATRVQALKAYLKTRGVVVDSLDKESVGLLMANPDIPDEVKEVINIRRQVGKTSTAKYETTLAVADPTDNRARGLLQYHGASTGRWAGRLIQPHNYPKGVKEEKQKEIIDGIMEGDPDMFRLYHGDKSMEALSGALRGTIIAPEGKTLVAADFNAIEPRVLFWLADDTSALAAYRAGGSPYLDMGAFLYRRPITKKDEQEYAVSKMTILGAGYGMGPVRFKAQCAAAQPKPVYVTEEEAARAIKAYREKYSTVVSMWYAMEGAAKKAIREPGAVVECCGGRVKWGMDGKKEFLVCRLPSGRHLRYYRPHLYAYIDPKFGEREEIRYWSAGLGGVLEEQKTYGGSLVENVVQAVARDLLAAGMMNCEAAGFELILTVHDEAIAEVDPISFESDHDVRGGAAMLKEFMTHLCKTPAWAAGCPVAAEGFVSRRYRK